MPTQITVLRVFVASPSDIIEERKMLEEIVQSLNKQMGSVLGINLEILKWETDTHPDIGEDVQSVINEQIGENYDIFIGILWKRFGSRTNRAMSGTEEEFRNAYKRAKEEPDNVKVMFYFNDTPVPISELDQEQIAKIKSFQSSLGDMGVYYWQYKSIEDFSKYVNLHLVAVMKEFRDKLGHKLDLDKKPVGEPKKLIEVIAEENNTEEEGFLDLVISSVEEINAGVETLKRINEVIDENTRRTKKRTEEMNNLEKPINPNQARAAVNNFSDDQEYFVARMNVEIPVLSKMFRSGIDKWTKTAKLWEDFKSDDYSQIEGALVAIKTFKEAIGNAKKQTVIFRDAVIGLPRLTTRFNHSRRKVVEMLNGLIDEYNTEESLSIEAEKVFTEIIERA